MVGESDAGEERRKETTEMRERGVSAPLVFVLFGERGFVWLCGGFPFPFYLFIY